MQPTADPPLHARGLHRARRSHHPRPGRDRWGQSVFTGTAARAASSYLTSTHVLQVKAALCPPAP
eukprot:2971439-Alexandrium_andersonii.AAC.1